MACPHCRFSQEELSIVRQATNQVLAKLADGYDVGGGGLLSGPPVGKYAAEYELTRRMAEDIASRFVFRYKEFHNVVVARAQAGDVMFHRDLLFGFEKIHWFVVPPLHRTMQVEDDKPVGTLVKEYFQK